MSNVIISLSKEINSNKKLLNVTIKLISVLNNNSKLKEKLEIRKNTLENLISSQTETLTFKIMSECNHLFVPIKNENNARTVICPKCGLTNLYEEFGIYGDSKECEMNRMFLSRVRNLDDEDVCIRLGIFTNPLYVRNLYLRALKQVNLNDEEQIIQKMFELKKQDNFSKTLK